MRKTVSNKKRKTSGRNTGSNNNTIKENGPLNVNSLSKKIIDQLYQSIVNNSDQVSFPHLLNSDINPCLICNYSECRISYAKVKYYAPHISYAKHHGYMVPENVLKVKNQQSDRVLSHLCGNSNCVNHTHLAIETKHVNDTRTYCHKFLICAEQCVGDFPRYLSEGAYACTHEPNCYRLTINN